MESEKVKEIKKALEDNANYEHHDKLGYIDGYKCKTVAYADILTLINELENEIKETSSYARGYADGIKNTYEVVIPDKLKQFAERLKEKLFDLGKIVNDNDIDETLKEFIK